jgi:23S rRNA pseudouridine2605 synthase
MRLNRFLAGAGLGSRRACEDIVREGRVTVNGKVVTQLATDVVPSDGVKVDGVLIKAESPLTLILNKPVGYICSTKDPLRRKTVFDLIPDHFPRLFYVGRLDVDSEGLLVMTNNGDLAQRLTHPTYKLPKTYMVRLDREMDTALTPKLVKGFLIEPGYAKMESIYRLSRFDWKVVLTQGLKRQIRLMFAKVGFNVVSLKRTEIGKLTLGHLKSGQWELLNDKEVQRFLVAPPVRRSGSALPKPRAKLQSESKPAKQQRFVGPDRKNRSRQSQG